MGLPFRRQSRRLPGAESTISAAAHHVSIVPDACNQVVLLSQAGPDLQRTLYSDTA